VINPTLRKIGERACPERLSEARKSNGDLLQFRHKGAITRNSPRTRYSVRMPFCADHNFSSPGSFDCA
jgi:hypothetical protein